MLVELDVAEAAVSDDGDPALLGHRGLEGGEEISLDTGAAVLELRLEHGAPHQRHGAAVVGLQAEDEHGLAVVVEVCPVHVDEGLVASGEEVPRPEREELGELELLVAYESDDPVGGRGQERRPRDGGGLQK
jgi:hypothetical protein